MPTPSFSPCQTIDEVITRLEAIVGQAKSLNHCEGYFAALYLGVTRKVKFGIQTGYFVDGPRMEKLDVLFANRYLEAYHSYIHKLPITQSWKIAFEGCNNNRLLILQHLLLGMNAHINLDLGIAASETAGSAPIEIIKDDFYKINEILQKMTGDVRRKINSVSPLFGLVEKIAKNRDEMLATFSINLARDGAWRYAQTYHACAVADRPNSIQTRDGGIANIASHLSSPTGLWLQWMIKLARLTEWHAPKKVIAFLEKES